MLKTRILLALFVFVGICSSCKKELSPEKQAAKDQEIIVDFLAKNSDIDATRHSSGVYYEILDLGTGTAPTLASQVTVSYVGRLLNGEIFDQSSSPVTFPLSNLIEGWQMTIPLIKKGGKIRLIVPSGLAYRSNSPGPGIPKNSVLDFTITLIDVK